jgi:hypothetical protein
MADKSFDDLDELMTRIRLNVAKVRQIDPAAGEELKELFRQLEDWVESLVVDSLKLNNAKTEAKKTPAKKK